MYKYYNPNPDGRNVGDCTGYQQGNGRHVGRNIPFVVRFWLKDARYAVGKCRMGRIFTAV